MSQGAKLDERQVRIMQNLLEFEDTDFPRIAERLKVSIGTVKAMNRIWRIRVYTASTNWTVNKAWRQEYSESLQKKEERKSSSRDG